MIGLRVGGYNEKTRTYTEIGAVATEFTQEDVNQQVEPMFFMNGAQAQGLMDSLWNAGIRPSEGHGSAGQKAALENHLAHVSDILQTVLPAAIRKEDK